MLENIKGVKIKGRCFKNEVDFVLFPNLNDRISIIYGKNGSGKSTISEGFSCIANNTSSPDISASLLDSEKNAISLPEGKSIFVFDEKYIDENVKIDDDGLGSIILLGGQVDLQAEIDTLSSKISLIESECRTIENDYKQYLEPQNPLNPMYHWSRIITILKQPGGWAETDSKIKNYRRNSSVTNDIIKEICNLSTKLSSSELQKKFDDTQALLDKVSDISTTYPDSIIPVIFDSNLEDKIIKILSIKIDEPVLTEREKLILTVIQNGGQSTIENARHEFSSKNTVVCPFCYQTVSESYKQELICNINRVLNKEVDAHKTALKAISFPVIVSDLTKYESLDSILVKSIMRQMQKCQELIDKYKDAIELKLNNVYTPFLLTTLGLCEEIENLNKLLKQLDDERVEFNAAASKKSTLVKELININKLIAHLQTEQIYKDYVKQNTNKEKIFNKLSEKQETLKQAMEKLQELQQRKSNIGLAINNINNALDYVFFAHGRLSIELKNDKYYLKSNGNDVKPKNVSLGERNIIALCYFFTQIMANQEVSKLYTNETFIIIDDPISSFDFENKVGIISFLRYQVDRIIKGNQNSKILVLSHDLETVFNLRKSMEEICQSTKGTAGVTKTTSVTFELSNAILNLLTNNHNEYCELLKKVYRYANGDIESDSITIGNAMRRVLEAFSTFNYQKSIEKVSCDKNVLNALGNHSVYFENLMYRFVLHGESHYAEQVYSIHDGYNFYEFISETEKQKTAKNVLCFMYLLSPHHISAYLNEEANAINNIKLWVKDIPDNQSFEIIESPAKRTIRLYDLPLSAGIGNECFDDIPYEDYETENYSCDFALKISGDSMEPNIKDKSIVLIKQVDVIDEGKVGAFYHNGKVYCKYLSYDNGETFLCSFNKAYAPIKIEEDDVITTYGEVVEIVQ